MKARKLFALLLALLLCMAVMPAVMAEESQHQHVTVEALVAANAPEAVFSRHQTMFCAVNDLLAGDWWFYCESGLYYEANDSGWSNLLDDDGNWTLEEEGDGALALSYIWYVMGDAERAAIEVLPEDLSLVIDADATLTEKIVDIQDAEDGMLTVTTRMNAQDTRGLLENRGVEDTEKNRDAEWEVVYLVAADTLEIVILLFIFAAEILGEIREFYVLVPHWDTLEIVSFTEYCVVGEDRSLVAVTEVTYDADPPAAVAVFQALREDALTRGAADAKTITAIYDALTPAEEVYSLTVPREVHVQIVFRDGYGALYADPERTAPFEATPDADGNYRIYIFAEA